MAAFIDGLARTTTDFKQTMAILQQTANSGPPHNEKKSKPLADDIFELKTRSGVRFPYFYDAGQIVVCTEAMHKPKKAELKRVIERAVRDRSTYIDAKRRKRIEIIEEEQ